MWQNKKDSYDISSEGCIERAKKEGLVVTYGDNYTLLLDIDTQEQYDTYFARLTRLQSVVKIQDIRVRPSKTGGHHKHIRIRLEQEYDTPTRLFFQAFLGSDPIRDILSYERFAMGDAHPILLASPKKEKKT